VVTRGSPQKILCGVPRIAAIVLLYAAALYLSVVYIQSIGSGIGIFSGLFLVTFISQSIETFFYLVDALILMPWLLTNSVNLCLEHLCSTEELSGLLLFFLVPIKPCEDSGSKPLRGLTRLERQQITLPENLKEILVGVLLGDGYSQKPKGCVNVIFKFKQSIIHKDYLLHLYELFKFLCPSAFKIEVSLPHAKTGKTYSSVYFNTYTLACFKELYVMFYPAGSKIIPLTIGELITPLSLAYWIADDGCWHKTNQSVTLCTDSFSLAEVELLINVLNEKFNLKCYKCRRGSSYRIIIPSYSIPVLQSLLKDIIPSMMQHKIGL